jgi:NAD(P)-dependent dehydrogenase (short-subunit alcohol dehydrogenase family)
VLVHGRDKQRTEDLVTELRAAGGEAEPYVADLASLTDVRRLAAEVAADHPSLTYLINNAGVGANVPNTKTVDGHQVTWAVNYLAPYVLATSLVPVLKAGATVRLSELFPLIPSRRALRLARNRWSRGVTFP